MTDGGENRETQFATPLDIIKDYAVSSTVQGLPHLVFSYQTKLGKLFWIVAILVMFSLGNFHLEHIFINCLLCLKYPDKRSCKKSLRRNQIFWHVKGLKMTSANEVEIWGQNRVDLAILKATSIFRCTLVCRAICYLAVQTCSHINQKWCLSYQEHHISICNHLQVLLLFKNEILLFIIL